VHAAVNAAAIVAACVQTQTSPRPAQVLECVRFLSENRATFFGNRFNSTDHDVPPGQDNVPCIMTHWRRVGAILLYSRFALRHDPTSVMHSC
jgi:hypothetical protein